MDENRIPLPFHQIRVICFSPTGGTETAALILAERLGERLGLPVSETDFTSPAAREESLCFGADDLVVFASPVYAGRLPNKIMPDWKRCFRAEGASAIPLVVFGNRSFDGALTEFRWILQEAGFRVLGGAAVVSRHAFSDKVGTGRPDEADRKEILAFADDLAEMIKKASGAGDDFCLPPVTEEEIPPYYTPLKEDGTPARFLKAKPETDPEKCDGCGICRDACPVGSINGDMRAGGVCIKCQACVRKCPKQAKYFTDEDFLSHVRMLERNYTRRAENFFLKGD